MRRLLSGLVVAAAITMLPALAWAGNQEIAQEIAASLKASGQMHHFSIGVKYQDGTAWLRGQVCSQEQAETAVALVSHMQGVNKVVNNLSVAPVASAAPAASAPATPARAAQFTGQIQMPEGAMAPEQRMALAPAAASEPAESNSWLGSAAKQLQSLTRWERKPQSAEAEVRQVADVEDAVPQPLPAAPSTRAMASRPMPVAYHQVVENGAPEQMPTSQAGQPMPMQAATPMPVGGAPMPMGGAPMAMGGGYCPNCPQANGGPYAAGAATARYDQPRMPCYAWPSYAASPNYAAVTYPRQYSATAWPYIGPFYPYPQVPLGWRKVTLEWDDGWWMLDFKDSCRK